MATTAASTASRGWLSNLSSMSSRIYFFLIILQIPLFRCLAYLIKETVNEKESTEEKLWKVRTNAAIEWIM
ncbi:hypothetical protein QQP08_025479 [Theobroma cacao]|nr:hypothetical protein QQP08_025479 [Theobroma cacao]